jgi:hypothetical protein
LYGDEVVTGPQLEGIVNAYIPGPYADIMVGSGSRTVGEAAAAAAVNGVLGNPVAWSRASCLCWKARWFWNMSALSGTLARWSWCVVVAAVVVGSARVASVLCRGGGGGRFDVVDVLVLALVFAFVVRFLLAGGGRRRCGGDGGKFEAGATLPPNDMGASSDATVDATVDACAGVGLEGRGGLTV